MGISTQKVRTKIKSVKNIAKITKAMEMVSASKMRKSVERADRGRSYAHMALETISHLAYDKEIKHPFLEKSETGERTLVLLIASNRGLCGGFNTIVLSAFAKLLETLPSGQVDCIVIGKRAFIDVSKKMLPIKAAIETLPDEIDPEDIHGISRVIQDEFRNGQYKNVLSVSMHYISALKQLPIVRTILPIRNDMINELEEFFILSKRTRTASAIEERPFPGFVFEPSPEEILNKMIPRLVDAIIYHLVLDSQASEHSARMIAMKNASENASSLVSDLSLMYNTARQAAVTQEISEIAIGAEALQG